MYSSFLHILHPSFLPFLFSFFTSLEGSSLLHDLVFLKIKDIHSSFLPFISPRLRIPTRRRSYVKFFCPFFSLFLHLHFRRARFSVLFLYHFQGCHSFPCDSSVPLAPVPPVHQYSCLFLVSVHQYAHQYNSVTGFRHHSHLLCSACCSLCRRSGFVDLSSLYFALL